MTKSLDMFAQMFDEKGNLLLNEVTLNHLEETYTANPVPPCRVCGAELGIASMGGGKATEYACDSIVRDPENPEAYWEHYGESKFTQYRSGDPMVVALVEAYRKLTGTV